MERKAKAISLVLSFILVIMMFAGCADDSSGNYQKIDEDTIIYNTETAVDVQNYTTYVNKEINLVLGILRTHIAVGDNIAKDKYIVDDEISNLEADLDKVAEAIESVELMHPPNDYEDDREDILQRMVNAEATLEAYHEMLLNESSAEELLICVDLMESEYLALSGSFNLAWE